MRKKSKAKKDGESSPTGNFGLASSEIARQGNMRVIAVRTLRHYWEKHAETEHTLKAWVHEVRKCTWTKSDDILKDFPKARPIPNNRCIFKINGGYFRLIVETHYNRGIVYVRFIGTHAEYDKIDATTI